MTNAIPATTTTPAVKVGDFFHESWGYDQTNSDYYQVVKVSASGKTVWLRHVAQAVVEQREQGATYGPLPDAFDRTASDDSDRYYGRWNEPPAGIKRTLKVSTFGGTVTPYVRMTSYSHAYLWDGKPAYETDIMFGH